MKNLHISKLLTGTLMLVTAFSIALTLSGAGSNAAEEAAIRKQIVLSDQKGRAALSLPDASFWSGAYKRPMVGADKGQAIGGEGGIEDRVPESEKTKTEPMRIVVSDSHDLAYEYSKSALEFTTKKSGKHINFDDGILRVWQKQGGVWKEAAMFAFPYDQLK
jgi:hypothetical protein